MENNNVNVENTGANNTGSNNTNTNIDYGKLEEIINKGINQKENSILKSYFSQQGLSEEEMKEAISNFKKSKKSEEEKNNKEYETLTNNYANLQKQFNQEKINNALNLALIKKGLTEEQIPFISKMVEVEGVLNDKSELNKEKLNENIENVFKAFPNLLNKKEDKPLIQIGTSNTSDNVGDDNLFNFNFGSVNKKK